MSAKMPGRQAQEQLITDDNLHPSRIKRDTSNEKLKNDNRDVMRMPTHSPKEREHLRTVTNNEASPLASLCRVESSIDKLP